MTIKNQMLSYTGVNILNAAVPFMLLPILTAYLTPNDYGILSLIALLMTVSLPIVLMNTHGLLIIEYSKLTQDRFKTLVSTIIWVPIIGFLFLEILFFIFESYILLYFHIPKIYIYYIPIFILLQSVPTVVPIIFQAKQEPLNFGKFKISLTIFNLLLSLFLVVVLNYGWEGRLFGIVGSFLVFTLIGLVVLYKIGVLKFAFDKVFLKEALYFGVPLIPHSIAGTFLIMSDRIFLSNMINNEAVGIYSVAFQIASAISIVLSSINQAWAPTLFNKLNNNPTHNEKIGIVKTTYKIMAIMSIITVVFIFLSPFIFDIFINKTYYEGKILSKYIAFAFLFQGFYFLITNYIFYTKKTYILSMITLSSLLVVVISNYYFIRFYGILGSAYAMALVWIIFFLITWYIANKLYKMPWSLT